MMTRGKKPQKLVQTTHSVANVLSRTFGLRSGYEVVDTDASIGAAIPSIEGDGERADALRSFLEHQRSIESDSSSPSPQVGDIVTAQCSGSCVKQVLVISRQGRRFKGIVVVAAADTILHDVLIPNEVFVTFEEVTIAEEAVTSKVDPNSVVLRRAWIRELPAFIGFSEWAGLSKRDENILYHEGDFVLLEPQDSSPLLDIVQVHRVRNLHVVVRRLHRHASQATFKHDRLLEPTSQLERIERARFKPVGKCHVSTLPPRSKSSWMSEATDFYVTSAGATLLRAPCGSCASLRRHERRQRRAMEPIRAMEIMCGAGGLTLGLDLSGACETTFAIDADAYAVETFRRHHPNANVSCIDAGDALRRAVAGHTEDAMLPRPGQVDLIAAGPPCQGFSRMNKDANPDAAEQDLRNLLVCTVLGWVDHLRPKYLVLENVEDFATFKLCGRSQGMVKLVLSVLVRLGYAATCGFVQSGAHGCAQSRRRFILLAARQELTLPKLPQPTHHFKGKAATSFSWSDAKGKEHAYKGPKLTTLAAVSIGDAIGDLRAFDWKDPHQVYEGPDPLELDRLRAGIAQLEVVSGVSTGFASTPYATDPNTSYQERMRVLGSETMTRVRQHQTSGLSARLVEQVVNVALHAGATYDSWSHPSVNKPELLRWYQSSEHLPGRHIKFERLDSQGYFKVLLTTLKAEESMLHPTQRRLLTVRECARAQGFPDWVEFETDDNLCAAYRQIGNAVPIPLALALGRSIVTARMRDDDVQQARQD